MFCHFSRDLRESSLAIMDYADLSDRVKALQRELVAITEHNRKYFAKRNHTATERAQHQELRERLFQIRAELHGLIEKSTRKAA
jgi:hypothetical protein